MTAINATGDDGTYSELIEQPGAQVVGYFMEHSREISSCNRFAGFW
ncbi:hypothetical protein SAMN03159444_02474 [Pseudomonas sp. NFACC02]|jgi:hypothetical protein|nr:MULTISPECIES: hypothetical protein [Pseudomonas]SEQ78524.1 hypothetical protein SAMN03159444_02474 [Pseudomonas sp. NFACC02]